MEIMTAPLEAVERRLLEKGVTLTPQRIEVGQVLFACPQHLSAEQILDVLRRRGSSVSKATVYNTLNLFVERGLLRAVTVDPARLYYDSNTASHHHFYNVDTGELSDIRPEDVVLERLPELPQGTEAEGVHVVVRVRNRV